MGGYTKKGARKSGVSVPQNDNKKQRSHNIMFTLTSAEFNDFIQHIFPAIYNATPGSLLFFRDFFGSQRSASPRIARFLYEQITAPQGSLKGIARLNKSRISEGIIRV